jgi:hypothetical protein
LIAVTSEAIRIGADGEESGVIERISPAIGITKSRQHRFRTPLGQRSGHALAVYPSGGYRNGLPA